jgi:hypothetical protein
MDLEVGVLLILLGGLAALINRVGGVGDDELRRGQSP